MIVCEQGFRSSYAREGEKGGTNNARWKTLDYCSRGISIIRKSRLVRVTAAVCCDLRLKMAEFPQERFTPENERLQREERARYDDEQFSIYYMCPVIIAVATWNCHQILLPSKILNTVGERPQPLASTREIRTQQGERGPLWKLNDPERAPPFPEDYTIAPLFMLSSRC